MEARPRRTVRGVSDVAPLALAAATAFVSTVAATPVRYVIDRRLGRDTKALEAEFAQRAEVAALVGSYRGRIVAEAEALHSRLLDVWRFEDRGWLRVDGDFSTDGDRRPFFFTTVYRFCSFTGLASGLERGALFLDRHSADDEDLALVQWVRALRWVLTDTRLFDGCDYAFETGRDHLFRDLYRSSCERVVSGTDSNASELHYREFLDVVREGRSMDHVLAFFDGLRPDEPRLRWDRLVCFDLLLCGLLGTCGYDEMRPSDDELKAVAAEVRHPQVAANLRSWLPRLGVADLPEGRRLREVLP